MPAESNISPRPSALSHLKQAVLSGFRLTNKPAVRLYNGYGNKTHCYLFGHAFSLSPLPRKRFRQNKLINALALLRLFMVRVKTDALIQFRWDGETYQTRTEADGFFKFEWQPTRVPAPGTYEVVVELLSEDQSLLATSKALLIIPHPSRYACISDIDDTFLISHSSHLRKRLFVLLTENAHSRKPFEGVVNHYQLLTQAGAAAGTTNPFFYVSSSEWNLYDYIRAFSAKNNLPEGVYLLNQVKTFSKVFKTGQNNHGTKFMRITRVLTAYPEQHFILLGDDSQEDPNIYAAVVQHFGSRIFAVYIRQVGTDKKEAVLEKLTAIQASGIHHCYFRHSDEAMAHSRQLDWLAAI